MDKKEETKKQPNEKNPLTPYLRIIQEKLKIECRYDVEAWYESLEDFTFKTSFLALTTPEAKCLRKLYRFRFLNGEPLNEREQLCLDNLKVRIQEHLEQNYKAKPIFLRLSTRSPKDSALEFDDDKKKEIYLKEILDILRSQNITKTTLNDRMKTIQKHNFSEEDYLQLLSDEESNAIFVYLMNATKKTLQITNSSQALDLLSSSERVSVDLYHLLVYKDVEECESEEELCQLIFREWVDMNDLDEFRCFFYAKKLTAISQYNFYIYDKSLNEKKEEIKQRIFQEFEKIKSFLNVENGVVDFLVQKDKVWVIELNPFNDYKGAGTGGALFSWQNDLKVLMEGPLEIRVMEKPLENCSHRIAVFGAEKILIDAFRLILDGSDQKESRKKCVIF